MTNMVKLEPMAALVAAASAELLVSLVSAAAQVALVVLKIYSQVSLEEEVHKLTLMHPVKEMTYSIG